METAAKEEEAAEAEGKEVRAVAAAELGSEGQKRDETAAERARHEAGRKAMAETHAGGVYCFLPSPADCRRGCVSLSIFLTVRQATRVMTTGHDRCEFDAV